MANLLLPGDHSCGRLLVVITIIGWYQPLVTSYNVAEHRLDYIKLGEGREYNYHYNDGISSGFDKRKFYKRPPTFKHPYTFKKFPSPVEQIATNEFQSHIPEQTSYVKQESLLPVYESHEKSVHYVPVDFTSSKTIGAAASAGDHGEQRPSSASYTGNLAERVIQMIHLRHPFSTQANASALRAPSGSSVVHFPSTGLQYQQHQQHPGSYQYFNAHPAPSGYELVRPISNFPPPRPYLAPALTTTKAPYVAPFLLRTSTTTTTTTPAPAMVESGKRPLPIPNVRPPYVAPAATSDPLLNSLSLANQLKYSSSRPAASNGGGANPQQPYEPEFDIDIRIDLRDDSA